WVVTVASEPGEPTLAEQAADREGRLRRDAAEHPLVKAALAAFPGAVIEAVRERGTRGGELSDAGPLQDAPFDDPQDGPLGPEPPPPVSEEDGLDFTEDEDDS